MTTEAPAIPAKSNRRRYIILGAVVVLLFGCCGPAAFVALSTPDATPEPVATEVGATAPTPAVADITAAAVTAAPTAEPQWVEVLRVEGNTDKKTEDFTVTGSQWRVTWDVVGERLFNIDAERSDGSGSESVVSLCSNCGKADTIMRGAGTYYLDITGGGDGYVVTVEDRR